MPHDQAPLPEGKRLTRKESIAPWAAGAAMVLLALFGLGIASRAVDSAFYFFGLALFGLGVCCVFGLIARYTRHPTSAPDDTGLRFALQIAHGPAQRLQESPRVRAGRCGRADPLVEPLDQPLELLSLLDRAARWLPVCLLDFGEDLL